MHRHAGRGGDASRGCCESQSRQSVWSAGASASSAPTAPTLCIKRSGQLGTWEHRLQIRDTQNNLVCGGGGREEWGPWVLDGGGGGCKDN